MVSKLELVGVDRRSANSYSAEGPDPQIIINTKAFTTGFLIFYMKTYLGHPEAQIYYDQGQGFTEANSIRLKTTRSLAYHVKIDALPGLCRIRFDPSTSKLDFKFRVFYTKSKILTGFLFFFLNSGKKKSAMPVGKRIVKTVRDAPEFFRWIGDDTGRESLRQTDELSGFTDAMSALAFDLRRKKSNRRRLPEDVLLSIIVPVYDARPSDLDALTRTFIAQDCAACELILADDGSPSLETQTWLSQNRQRYFNIIVIDSAPNAGISAATNRGLAIAKGKWAAFMDHDDAFSENSLSVLKDALLSNSDASMFYTDEYIADEDLKITGFFFKPAFDPVLLCGMNYINHFSIFRREDMGLFDSKYDGSQDYEFILRYLSKLQAGVVVHIPYPAYIWRRTGHTFSARFLEQSTARARKAVSAFAEKLDPNNRVAPALNNGLHRLDFYQEEVKGVTVIIPNKNSFNLMTRLLEQLYFDTAYRIEEIIVVDNGSDDENIMNLYDRYAEKFDKFRVNLSKEAFNFAKMCNTGARLATNDHLLFLNNDIEVLHADWLGEMMQCFKLPNVGIVGAKLLYPDQTIQHNGVIVGLGGVGWTLVLWTLRR